MDNAFDLVARSSDPAFVIDGTQRIMALNSQAEALLEVSNGSVLGKACYNILSGKTMDGRPICGLHCAAAVRFQHDQPFSTGCLITMGGDRNALPFHVSTIVLSGQVKTGVPKSIIFLRPLGTGTKYPAEVAPLLRVYALGTLRLYVGPGSVQWRDWPRKQAITLFKYLLTRRGYPLHREFLLEGLWPDTPLTEGLGRLKVLVHSLRRNLQPQLPNGATSSFVLTDGESYLLPTGQHLWVDVDWFQELAQRGDEELKAGHSDEAMRTYEEADAVYRGDYLEEDPYNDWLAPERERLRELHLSLLVRMAHLYAASGNYQRAVAACRQSLALDPCRESVHRQLMSYLWLAGQRAEALSQYKVCRQILLRELGVDPMPATKELYQRILQGAPPVTAYSEATIAANVF